MRKKCWGLIFLSEVVGTAMLLLLGGGVVANVALTKTKGNGAGFLMVNFGWGLAVFAGVFVSYKSGASPEPGRHPGHRRLWRHGVRPVSRWTLRPSSTYIAPR